MSRCSSCGAVAVVYAVDGRDVCRECLDDDLVRWLDAGRLFRQVDPDGYRRLAAELALLVPEGKP